MVVCHMPFHESPVVVDGPWQQSPMMLVKHGLGFFGSPHRTRHIAGIVVALLALLSAPQGTLAARDAEASGGMAWQFRSTLDTALRRKLFGGGSKPARAGVPDEEEPDEEEPDEQADDQQADAEQAANKPADSQDAQKHVEDHVEKRTNGTSHTIDDDQNHSEDAHQDEEANLSEEPGGCRDALQGESRWYRFKKKDALQTNIDAAAKVCRDHKSERKSALKVKAEIEKLRNQIRDKEVKKEAAEELLNAKRAVLKDIEAELDSLFRRTAEAKQS
eukprot:CAMPEP_0179070198 /NCGR_PEP_ID=MMETSP0796-20121207/30897_1 /TAXON_ID=73915 /ORGANISM="Pyrodinium bahamense, Strain pbaha01" /LENGTH=274 /DNA_ID=CAMNT_0020767283 /DNA_START=20 /DNA_END=844 /DNA_ORIENTATION=-